VDVQEEVRAQLAERGAAFSPGDLVRMLTAAAELESQGSLRRSPNPRLPIEMLLLRMSYLDRTVSVEELLGALGGAPVPSGGAGSGGPSGATGGPHTESAPAEERAPKAAPETSGRSSHEPGAAPAEAETESNGAAAEGAVAPVPTDDVVEAWHRWLDAGRGLPAGLSAFLMSADARDVEGTLVLRPIPGPAYDRMVAPTVLAALRAGLEPWLGRTPAIEIEPASGSDAATARITREEVREDTLRALYRQEPRLERAVQVLDLELMD
jgi:hypothetical protein